MKICRLVLPRSKKGSRKPVFWVVTQPFLSELRDEQKECLRRRLVWQEQ